MSWAGPSLPRSVFQSRRGGQHVAPGRPRGEGAEEPWACPSPHCEGGWTLHWTCQQDRVQEESRGHQGASRRWLWGQLVVRTQVPRGGRGPGVNPDGVLSEGPAASTERLAPRGLESRALRRPHPKAGRAWGLATGAPARASWFPPVSISR